MDLFSSKTIKELLSKYQTRPSKGLGQNFLIDKNVLEKIVAVADVKPNDIVLEVGPGVGTLTQELALKAEKVIAIEKDKTMVEILKETLSDFSAGGGSAPGGKNIEIIQGDTLTTELRLPKNYKLVANIPYYLTSPLIRKFLESENQPQEIILMIQKEVAQRICSKPPKMSLLAVSVQFYAGAKIISFVSKNCFFPAPKIDSAIIKITPRLPRESRAFAEKFFTVVRAGFSHPRKQLAGNLSKVLKIGKEKTVEWMEKNKIKPSQRAETLSISDWINLTLSLTEATEARHL